RGAAHERDARARPTLRAAPTSHGPWQAGDIRADIERAEAHPAGGPTEGRAIGNGFAPGAAAVLTPWRGSSWASVRNTRVAGGGTWGPPPSGPGRPRPPRRPPAHGHSRAISCIVGPRRPKPVSLGPFRYRTTPSVPSHPRPASFAGGHPRTCVTVAQLLSAPCHTVGVKVKRVPVMMRPADVARLDALARARDVSRGAL